MSETWKDISYMHGYQVSNKGNVRSVDRYVDSVSKIHSAHKKLFKGRLLSGTISGKSGYLKIDYKGQKHYIHRIVATEFCEGFKEGLVVNHKNGIRTDNRVENLEWVTQGENIKHSYQFLGRKSSLKGRKPKTAYESRPVISTDLVTGEEKFYEAINHAAKNGFSSGNISSCCNGKRKSHAGKSWRFGDAA